MNQSIALSASAITLSLALFSSVRADTTHWNVDDGSFVLAGNWSDGVPGGDDTAIFRRGFVAYTVTSPSFAQIAVQQMVIGTNEVTLTSPINGSYTVHDTIRIGEASEDFAILNTTSHVTAGHVWIGAHSNSLGGLNVNARTFNAEEVFVGYNDATTGGLNVQFGAKLITGFGSIAAVPGSIGGVTVVGDGSTWTTGDSFRVGTYGTGTLTIAGGGSVLSTHSTVGTFRDSDGTVTVDGVGSNWTNSSRLDIGPSGRGILTITNGGSVSNSSSTIGDFSPYSGRAHSMVTVRGPGSNWNNYGQLAIGGNAVNDGTGTLLVQGGGRVNVVQDTVLLPGGLLRLEGGTLATRSFGFEGGQFLWTAGKLHVDLYNGNLTIPSGGTLAPGRSAGITTIAGNYAQPAGAALEIEIGGTHDLVSVTGNAVLGGQLQLALLGDFVPSASDTFVVFNAVGGISGVFSNVTTGNRRTTIDGKSSFIVHYGPGSELNQKQIILTGFALTGDLNSNGFVGQDDLNMVLSAWSQSVTPPGSWMLGDPSGDGSVGQDDLNDVLVGWGQGTPPVMSAMLSVPEPSALWLAVIAVAGLMPFCRRATRR